jgi:putative hydrolase of the HAD superfamily
MIGRVQGKARPIPALNYNKSARARHFGYNGNCMERNEKSDRMEEGTMIKAVIFDFDGLIVDTESAWYMSYKETLRQRYGIDMPIEVWGRVIGTSMQVFNPFAYIAEQTGKTIDVELVRREAQPLFERLMKEQGPRPGVADYLREAKQLGLSVGLASSSDIGWIEPYLVRFGLIGYFDALATADDVTNVKPDPELYLKALERLQVKGEETIAFEDSVNGSNAAKAAGVNCVIVPNPVTAHMTFENYDLRIASMAETGLEQVLAHFNQAHIGRTP